MFLLKPSKLSLNFKIQLKALKEQWLCELICLRTIYTLPSDICTSKPEVLIQVTSYNILMCVCIPRFLILVGLSKWYWSNTGQNQQPLNHYNFSHHALNCTQQCCKSFGITNVKVFVIPIKPLNLKP